MHRHDHPDDAPIPPALRDDLRRLYAGSGRVDPRVERAVLDAAERAGARRLRVRPVWGARVGGAVAAAAGLGVLVVLANLLSRPSPVAQRSPVARGPQPRYSASPADTNGDGAVDVLDVMRLARAVQAGTATRDFNDDGVSDARDVDVLAAHVVRVVLPSEGRG